MPWRILYSGVQSAPGLFPGVLFLGLALMPGAGRAEVFIVKLVLVHA